jgi:hypothetical protein
MTKVELEDFVREAFATYNQTFYEADREYILRAWWNLLKDLEVSDVRARFAKMAVASRVLPTPGMLRRAVVESKMDKVPPSPQEAWALLQRITQGMNQGTHQTSEIHPVLGDTIKVLGPVAFTLSTNGDREYFMGVYSDRLADYLVEMYKVDGETI